MVNLPATEFRRKKPIVNKRKEIDARISATYITQCGKIV